MTEPSDLVAARALLSRAEDGFRTPRAIAQFEEGLELLEEIVQTGTTDQQRLARNIAKAYVEKVYASVAALLATRHAPPEPELEHLFKLILVFDAAGVALPENAKETKLRLARELLRCYLEGHAPEEKRAALEALLSLANDEG